MLKFKRHEREACQNMKRKEKRSEKKKERERDSESNHLFFLCLFILFLSSLEEKGCDMVCYRERESEVNSPTLVCLNQQSLRLTAKTVGE